MRAIVLRKWDSSEYLKTDQDMLRYLELCVQEASEDAAFIAKAHENVARAKRMSAQSSLLKADAART